MYTDLTQSSDELNAMVSKTTREAAKKEGQELLKAGKLTAAQNGSWWQERRQKPFRKLTYPELLISRFYCIQEYICNKERAFLIFLLYFQVISSALNTFAVKHRITEPERILAINLVQHPYFTNTRSKSPRGRLTEYECPSPSWAVVQQGARSSPRFPDSQPKALSPA